MLGTPSILFRWVFRILVMCVFFRPLNLLGLCCSHTMQQLFLPIAIWEAELVQATNKREAENPFKRP